MSDKNKNKTLSDFDGWAGVKAGYEIEEDPKSVKEIKDDVKKEEEAEIKALEEEKAKELEKEVFGDFVEVEKNKEGGKKPEDNKSSSKPLSYNSFLTKLKDNGIVDYELEEDKELNEKDILEIVSNSFEEKANEKAIKYLQELPEDVAQLNRFVLEGGDYREYIKRVSRVEVQTDIKNLDPDVEENAEIIIKRALTYEGEDESEIADRIEYLKSNDKLSSYASKKLQKLKQVEKEIKRREFDSLAEKKRLEQETLVENKKVLSETLNTTEFKNLEFTGREKKSLPDYIIEKTVGLENGAKISKMQKDLLDVLRNPKGQLQLAKLLKGSKNGELDLNQIAKLESQKVIKKVEDNLQRNVNNKPKTDISLFQIFDE